LPLIKGMEEKTGRVSRDGSRREKLTGSHPLLKEGEHGCRGRIPRQRDSHPRQRRKRCALDMPKGFRRVKLAKPQLFAGDTVFAGQHPAEPICWGGFGNKSWSRCATS